MLSVPADTCSEAKLARICFVEHRKAGAKTHYFSTEMPAGFATGSRELVSRSSRFFPTCFTRFQFRILWHLLVECI